MQCCFTCGLLQVSLYFFDLLCSSKEVDERTRSERRLAAVMAIDELIDTKVQTYLQMPLHSPTVLAVLGVA